MNFKDGFNARVYIAWMNKSLCTYDEGGVQIALGESTTARRSAVALMLYDNRTITIKAVQDGLRGKDLFRKMAGFASISVDETRTKIAISLNDYNRQSTPGFMFSVFYHPSADELVRRVDEPLASWESADSGVGQSFYATLTDKLHIIDWQTSSLTIGCGYTCEVRAKRVVEY